MTVTEYINRKRNAAVRLEVATSREPGRGRLWSAAIGRWYADGKTEKAATDELTGRLSAFLTDYRHPEIVTFRGYTAVISLDIGQSSDEQLWWAAAVICPDGRRSFSGMSGGSWEETIARSRYNLAQRTTDWLDDASVHEAAAYVAATPAWKPADPGATLTWFTVDELYRYAAWQRAARHAIAAGHTDWHEWATNNSHRFVVKLPATT